MFIYHILNYFIVFFAQYLPCLFLHNLAADMSIVTIQVSVCRVLVWFNNKLVVGRPRQTQRIKRTDKIQVRSR